MDINKAIKFWLNESEEDFKVSGHLLEKGDFSYALFFCHLSIEKLLKAVYVKRKKEQPPYIHNLLRIAELCGIETDEKIKEILIRVTAYNIEARYPDEKNNFRKICTEDFTNKELKNAEKVIEWLKSLLQ